MIDGDFLVMLLIEIASDFLDNEYFPDLVPGARRHGENHEGRIWSMFRSHRISIVMAGLVPAIPISEAPWCTGNRDARDKPAHNVPANKRKPL
jgi:hypothetical protein